MSTTCATGLGLLCAITIGCGDEGGGPDMRPGENCLDCHLFAAAGTVFDGAGHGVSGVTVRLTDSSSRSATATTSSSGNFHVSGGVSAPFTVTLEQGGTSVPMPMDAASGGCNGCHVAGGSATAIHFP